MAAPGFRAHRTGIAIPAVIGGQEIALPRAPNGQGNRDKGMGQPAGVGYGAAGIRSSRHCLTRTTRMSNSARAYRSFHTCATAVAQSNQAK